MYEGKGGDPSRAHLDFIVAFESGHDPCVVELSYLSLLENEVHALWTPDSLELAIRTLHKNIYINIIS